MYCPLVVYVSDNQSWMDAQGGRGTATLREWARFQARSPKARLVCIDVQPYGTTQASDRDDLLNVGGFSDRVWEVVARFRESGIGTDHWAQVIEEVTV
jgi:60 kDa SS-A/Ro ribonucleoprotein